MKATLTYHSIDESGSAISVPPAVFEQHLRWLASGRVRVLSLDALASHPVGGADAVAVTFDDGFQNAGAAVGRLLDHGLPVTIFAVSRHVGGTNAWGRRPDTGVPHLPLLAWPDLESIVARGGAVEAQTRSHLPLTHLSSAQLDDELLGCREDLRERLGITSAHLAYPYGDVDAAVAARAGMYYRSGYTTAFRVLAADDHPLQLPRLDMYYFRETGLLEQWGTPSFSRRVAWCRLRRQLRATLVGGRAPRRLC